VHENREVPAVSGAVPHPDRSGKVCGRNPDKHVAGKSYTGVVPMKEPNEAEGSAEEVPEGRPVTEGKTVEAPATRTQGRGEASSGLGRIRTAARRDRRQRFTSLLHHITVDLLRDSYKALKRDAVPGVDGVTWRAYGQGLEERLVDLHGRVHRGRYRAQPSKRGWVPKRDGRGQRPLGIASLEDKIVQLALVWVLNQVYEEDFVGFSYGFRSGRSQHDALDALWVGITTRKVNWVLDADIRSFFDRVDHEQLVRFVEHRIGDPRVVRLIRKWLRAGVSEEGEWSRGSVGVPQGAVISPLLANIYLHYALDLWVKTRRREACGEVIIVRYADDFVMGFQYRREAEQFLAQLRERLAEFGLELHEDKSRLIEFGRFAAVDRAARGEGKPETFDFLGFTHICAKTRKSGRFTVVRKTIAKRMRAKVKEVRRELMCRRHAPVPEVGRWLQSVVRGYFNYHAIPGNKHQLDAFRTLIIRAWLRSLRRRSQAGRKLTWDRVQRLVTTWIPRPRIIHPYPNRRLCVSTPGRNRMR
jgi:RNA-directed DNA polymerase